MTYHHEALVRGLRPGATSCTGERHVLLALAAHANAEGWCWPSHATLARQTELSGRQVRRYVHQLHEAGWLAKVDRRRREGGGLGVWVYRLRLDRLHAEQWRPGAATEGAAEPVDTA